MEKNARSFYARHGVTVHRPLSGQRQLALAYLRSGPKTDCPILLVPGGPGMSSVTPYAALRSRAAKQGLDVLMMEHRGVGLSRRDTAGAELLTSDVTLINAADDLAAVLDAEGINRVTAYGASYGTYLAQLFAVRHPERVHALVLDSPMLDPRDDLEANRLYRRNLLWDGASPETAGVARKIRALADAYPPEQVSQVVQITYEFAGAQKLSTLCNAWLQGRMRWLWKRIANLGRGEIEGQGTPFLMEPDLVKNISYAELGYGLPVDGKPLDPQLFFHETATRMPEFTGPPVDLREEVPKYDFPVAVLSGGRDLRTPLPVAERITALAPRGVLAVHPDHGHSFLDTHPWFALSAAATVHGGDIEKLPERIPAMTSLPRPFAARGLGAALNAAAVASRVAARLPAFKS